LIRLVARFCSTPSSTAARANWCLTMEFLVLNTPQRGGARSANSAVFRALFISEKAGERRSKPGKSAFTPTNRLQMTHGRTSVLGLCVNRTIRGSFSVAIITSDSRDRENRNHRSIIWPADDTGFGTNTAEERAVLSIPRNEI
jgi:hypothetical protein